MKNQLKQNIKTHCVSSGKARLTHSREKMILTDELIVGVVVVDTPG